MSQSVPGVYAFRWSRRTHPGRYVQQAKPAAFTSALSCRFREGSARSFSRVYVEYHQHVPHWSGTHTWFRRWIMVANSWISRFVATLAAFRCSNRHCLTSRYSPLIALWFACQKEECDGKVFSINTADSLVFGKVTHQVMQKEISEVLATETDTGSSLPWIWEPIATGDADDKGTCSKQSIRALANRHSRKGLLVKSLSRKKISQGASRRS